jgi:hypothetical protein
MELEMKVKKAVKKKQGSCLESLEGNRIEMIVLALIPRDEGYRIELSNTVPTSHVPYLSGASIDFAAVVSAMELWIYQNPLFQPARCSREILYINSEAYVESYGFDYARMDRKCKETLIEKFASRCFC